MLNSSSHQRLPEQPNIPVNDGDSDDDDDDDDTDE
jgi:hypothetical protein